MSEFLTLGLLFVAGWLVSDAAGVDDWGRIPLGYILATGMAIVSALVLTVAGLPTSGMFVIGVTLATTAVVVALSPTRNPSLGRLVNCGAGLILLFAGTWWFRAANLAKYHIDSFAYLIVGRYLAHGDYGHASANILEKRQLGSGVIHSLAPDSEAYLQAHGPLLFFALVASFVWVLLRREGNVGFRGGWLVAVGAALIITNNRLVWGGFYINNHMLVATFFLMIVATAWLVGSGPRAWKPLLPVVLVGVPVLVVSRPEGFILASLALLPLLLDDRVTSGVRRMILISLGLSTAGWFTYVTVKTTLLSGSIDPQNALPAVYGALALALVPLIGRVEFGRWKGRILVLAEIGLWVVLGVFAMREPEVLWASARATYENLVKGAGGWGSSLVVLGLLVLGAWLLGRRDGGFAALRFPVTTSVPSFALLAYLREGAYRVGNGDSLNRMMIHVVPVAILFVTAVCLDQLKSSASFGAKARRFSEALETKQAEQP